MSFARFSGVFFPEKCALDINFRQYFCRRKGIAKRREGVILYRNSDNSDSTASSRTHVTGQTGRKPDEGIISQQNNTSNVPHDTKFDSIEIPVCVRSSRTRSRTSNNATGSVPMNPRQNTSANVPHQQKANTSPVNTAKRRQDMSRTGSAPYLYGNDAARRQAQMSRTRTSVTTTVPRTANGSKKRKRHPIIAWILKNRKAAVTCTVLLLCICITIPLAVYGGAISTDDSSEADFEMLGTLLADESVLNAEEVYLDASHGSNTFQSESPSASESITEEVTEEIPSDTEEDPEETENPEATESESEEQTEPEEESTEAEPEVPVGFKVTVQFYDRELLTCTTGPTTLRQILEASGIWLTENEKPSIGLDDPIEYESWITVSKTEYKQVTESEAIPYSSETVNSTSVPRGTYQTVVAGQNGVRDTVYTVEYLNGVEVNRTKEYDYIAVYPVNEVNHYGVGGTFTAPDGTVYSYSHCVNVRATYYNIHGMTASGMPTGNNVVATDPGVFPLGTRMYVLNSTFDMGVKIAADTGGAVHGNLIDIWMDATSPYYEQFAAKGVWDMTVYVLD